VATIFVEKSNRIDSQGAVHRNMTILRFLATPNKLYRFKIEFCCAFTFFDVNVCR